MIFIDTIYAAALVNRRDQHHFKAVELAPKFKDERFLTTDSVLLEIGNALSRGRKEEAVEIINHFLTAVNVQVLRLTPELFDRGFDLYATHRGKDWGLIDCISFVVMRDFGVIDALTHDIHFVQADFRALMRDEP
jgi:predicted nucleic acid-binding protein